MISIFEPNSLVQSLVRFPLEHWLVILLYYLPNLAGKRKCQFLRNIPLDTQSVEYFKNKIDDWAFLSLRKLELHT